MDKATAVDNSRFVNVQLPKDLGPVNPLALLKVFRDADLAAAKAERVVVSAAASQNRTGVWASPEQVLLATSLRATADQIFKVTMREWSKLR